MGSWNYRVFDDDTAYDILNGLKYSTTIVADMEEFFDEAISSQYVWYDVGCGVLVCAAIIDIIINDTPYNCDLKEYLEWLESLKQFDLFSLKRKAIQAIDSVISTQSELNEQWSENQELYCSWHRDKIEMQERLRK